MKKNLVEKGFKDIIKASPKERPILECVNFGADGSLTATNSHTLLRIKNHHKKQDRDFLLNLNTFMPEETVSYPDIDRIIPANDGDAQIKLDAATLDVAYAFVNGLRSGTFVRMWCDHTGVTLACGGVSRKLVPVELKVNKSAEFSPNFNATYLKSAFAFLKDWVRQPECQPGVATIHIYADDRPVMIDSYPATYLVCPTRVKP